MTEAGPPHGSTDASPDAISEAEDARAERPNYLLHAGLFAATCGTTYIAGGLAFSATLMTILVVHEMGHYVAARIHGVDASLPFFVPLPPQISLGTLGAVIKMSKPISDRNKLIDVGAAGPLAGLAVAIPLLVIGISISPVEPVSQPGTFVEGNSIAYIAIKYLVTGLYLPAADGTDVALHPMAFAAWVGLLITFINLIPIGQLDGGHVARAFFGNRHEQFSRVMHWLLLAVGLSIGGYLAVDTYLAGYGPGTVLEQAFSGGMPWAVWAGMLLFMRWMSGGVYHPDVGEEPLTPGRRTLVIATSIVFILIFTPVPLRPVLT